MKKKVIVRTRNELKDIVEKTIKEEGFECDLNFIDTSEITDMSWLFYNSGFNGDISKWNTSNVKGMEHMFDYSKFNGDISQWNVEKVEDMSYMFYGSEFNGDIKNWNVRKVIDMTNMFDSSVFNGDISRWNTSRVTDMSWMFAMSKFNGDISKWDVSHVTNMEYMFGHSVFNRDISMWNTKNIKNYIRFGLPKESYLPPRFRNPLVQSKSYIGWKKLRGELICKLLIPEDTIKLKGGSNKCRTNKVKVLEITKGRCTKTKGYSIHDPRFVYIIGKEVVPDSFDLNRWNECSSGIHFFLTKEEAENYWS